MAICGYRRISSATQSMQRQDLDGCDKVFEEAVTGAKRDRPQLNAMLDWIREGDEVRVHSIDRLARDLRDLQNIVSTIVDKGAQVTFIKEQLKFSADEDDKYSKLQLQLMGAFAEFERSIIKERQREGIEKAKQQGRYTGRKATIDPSKLIVMRSQGMGATAIAKELGIGRASVYRILEAAGD